ncbi:MAG: hypothetical protein DWQ44_08975 [Bacteroidetes bacterium]|nr:MAG: hypothetical protein DWQ33_02800 [Bacteroidota bacterium]REK06422.1 MAG: hypothetical protein DWQ39_02765 [Bacteroidota bacterium]REK33188.1 MAG: hypothetical protein DWQ44_08975 [Bacteroidota bacterium]REK47024.1 MAG: hypothetical protein DWQ48_13305 [Bacteroidota bacterium]
MRSVEDIIEKKIKLLESVGEEFLEQVQKTQLKLYRELLEILGSLEISKGRIVLNTENLRITEDVLEELREMLFGSEYIEAVRSVASGMEKGKELSDEYFQKAFPDFSQSELADKIFENSKKNAVDLLAGATPETGFLQELKDEISLAVNSGASWQDTVDRLRLIAIGDETQEVDGKLLKYAKQVASDSIAISDRSYNSAIADELESEWFLFAGDVLPTSRQFCIERSWKYFHYKEVESWAELEWSGKNDATNKETIYSTLGGWRCQHSLIPVSIDTVPRDVIERNMANGNFTPSEFEKQELEL